MSGEVDWGFHYVNVRLSVRVAHYQHQANLDERVSKIYTRQLWVQLQLRSYEIKSDTHDNLWLIVDNVFGHEGGDLRIMFKSHVVTNVCHQRITSRGTKWISIFSVSHTSFYIPHCVLKSFTLFHSWTWIRWKAPCNSRNPIFGPHANVEYLRHIRQLFMHRQFCAKSIFTSYYQPWIIIFRRPEFALKYLRKFYPNM